MAAIPLGVRMRPLARVALATTLLTGLALGLAACGPPPSPGGTSPTWWTGGALPPASTVTYRIQPGVGVNLTPGVDVGFFVSTGGGGAYRLFWTGDSRSSGTLRHFFGSVWTPGNFNRWAGGCDGYCPS